MVILFSFDHISIHKSTWSYLFLSCKLFKFFSLPSRISLFLCNFYVSKFISLTWRLWRPIPAGNVYYFVRMNINTITFTYFKFIVPLVWWSCFVFNDFFYLILLILRKLFTKTGCDIFIKIFVCIFKTGLFKEY